MIRLRPMRPETGLWFSFWVVVLCCACFVLVWVWDVDVFVPVSAVAAMTSAGVCLWPKQRPSSGFDHGSTEQNGEPTS